MNFTRRENIKPPAFHPKRLAFSFPKSLNRFWCGGSYNRTYFFNALGMLAPSFERLFILSVLKYRKPLAGTDLEPSIKSFLAQEAQHDHQIRKFNQALKQFGYPVESLEQANLSFCKKLNKRCSAKTQLAFTMGAEHLISVLSHFNLADGLWFKEACPQMAALWRWHAIEEIEHKSVAFDVYHRVCGQYWRKILAYIVVLSVIGGMWARNWWTMAKHDKLLSKWSFWKDLVGYLFLKPALFIRLIKPLFAYFNPWFHPWQHDNNHLIHRWKLFFDNKPSDIEALAALASYKEPKVY